jgi:dipeptidyl-peptidase-4
MPYWKPDGSSLLVQWMPRSQDQLKIYEVNPTTGNIKEFYSEEQKTWVKLTDDGERISFLKNGKGFILISDKTGWKHLYHYNMNGKLLNQITTGNFTVNKIEFVDESNQLVYFSARGKENTARKDYYSVRLDGTNLQRLTFGEYNHSLISLSPTADYFITTYSNSSTPEKMTLVNNQGKIIKELGDSKASGFEDNNIAKIRY